MPTLHLSRSISLTALFVALVCAAYGQQTYNTCKVFQFLDNDSSFLENIALKEYADGRIIKDLSVADQENNDYYFVSKRLEGDKIFMPGDSAKVKDILRSYFVRKDYRYNNTGKLEYVLRRDDVKGTFDDENSVYQYGGDGRLARKYALWVAHELIHGVKLNVYEYDHLGRLISDSATEDTKLVTEYQWDEKNSRLVIVDMIADNYIPIPSQADLRFHFVDPNDTMNRRREVKKYRYFDGGYETRSTILYYFTDADKGPVDSVFTGNNGKPLKLVTRADGKFQLVKSYYYDKSGNLSRTVSDTYEDDNPGRITRVYKYSTEKPAGEKSAH